MLSQWTSSKRTDARRILALGVIGGITVAITSWAAFDIWLDLSQEGRPLWSTLLENTFSLLFALGVPLLAWRLRRTYDSVYLWTVARWTAAGCGGALLLAVVVAGIQALQMGLRPRVLFIQIAAFGAAAGLFVGIIFSRLGMANESLQEEIDRRRGAEEELYERIQETKKKNRMLGLVTEVSTAANEAESFEESLQMAVDAVCTQVGWPLGHAFLRTEADESEHGTVQATGIWNRDSRGHFEAFKAETEELAFAKSDGLPGRVLRDGEPVWIENVTSNPTFTRKNAAAAAGIQGTVAFPVWANGEIAAVVELYSHEEEPLDEELRSAVETVGFQLGRVAEREKARADLTRLNENLEERAQKRAQEVYRERERLRSLLDSIPDEVWFCDKNGEISLVNQAVAEEFSFESAEDAHRPLKEVLLTLDVYDSDGRPRPIEESPLLRSLEGEVVEGEEELLYRPETGETRHRLINSAPLQEPSGEITGSVAVIRDITGLKRTEERLRKRERDFTALANGIPQLAWMAEPDGHIYWYNQRWHEYAGTTLEEMEGWGWKKIHHPDHLDRALQKWTEAVETGEPFEATFPLRRKDGQYRWFLTRAMPIRDEEGRVVRWFGTNTDITKRLKLEEELKELNETLEERVQERTRQVRELASELTVAEQRERRRIARLLHDDLQQKLYGIQLKLSFLQNQSVQGRANSDENPSGETSEMSDDQQHLLSQIDDLDERLEEVVEMTRHISIGMSPPILESDGLTGALEWLQSHVRKRFDLEVDLTATREFREVDENLRVLLFRIVQELLSNVATHTDVARAEVQVQEDDGILQIQVRDDGVGFDSEEVMQTKSGDAFGLTIARERIRFFEGDLSIESTPGEGTQVTVEVPLKKISTPERDSTVGVE